MQCPNCSHENPENNKFCGECGAKLPPKPPVLNDYFQDRREVRFADPGTVGQQAPSRPIASVPLRPSDSVIATAEPESDRKPSLSSSNLAAETPEFSFVDNTTARKQTGISPVQPVGLNASTSAEGEKSQKLEPTKDLKSEAPRTPRESGRRTYSSSISGPSFLGLNYDLPKQQGFIYGDEPEGDGGYLLDEEAGRTVSWRALALFALLIAFAALGYVQWRSQKNRSGANEVGNVLNRNGGSLPEGSSPNIVAEKQKAEAERQQKAGAGGKANNPDNQPAASASTKEDQTEQSEETAKDQDTSAKTNEQNNENAPAERKTNQPAQQGANVVAHAKGVTVTSNGPRPQEGVTVSTRRNSANEDVEKPESDNGDSDSAAKPSAGRSSSKAMSLGAKDPLFIRAQNFIQGRGGVPQDCQMGLNLLHKSAATENPKAQIELGALYMSGYCVTQDRVSAYNWFTRALANEPRNQYVERNRASLWAHMTPEERTRIRQTGFY